MRDMYFYSVSTEPGVTRKAVREPWSLTVADVSDGDVIGDLPYLIIAKSLDYTYYKALGYVIDIYTTISSGPV